MKMKGGAELPGESVNSKAEELCKTIFQGIQRLHTALMNHPAMTENLLRCGFTFDVVGIGGEVQLLELNDSGAMSGCGSCLYHWIVDVSLLYGLDCEVEFRIAT